MFISNEHLLIILLVLYIVYELYTKEEEKDIVKNIPEYSIDKIKSECTLPDKQTSQCVADMLVKTGCVKCSLDKCDKNKTISDVCYKNEEHICQKVEEKKCATKPNLFENIQISMHDNKYNDMHKSYLNSTYITPPIENNIPLSYNDNNDNNDENSFDNLINGNSTILNNIYINKPQECTSQKNIGLERSLDGSFFKYSRLG